MSSKTLVVQVSARRACGAVIESSIGSLAVSRIVERGSVDEGLSALAAFGPFDRVIVSMPAEDAAFRILSLPFTDRRRISQAVGPALEEHVPLSLDEAVVAWDRVGPQQSGDIIAAMAPSSRIEELRSRVESTLGAPRRLLWMPPVILAAYRRALGENASFVAVDVGPDGAVVASIRDGGLQALRLVAPCEPDLMKRNVLWSVRTIATPGERVVAGGAWAAEMAPPLAKELPGLQLEMLPATSPVQGIGDRDWRELTGLVGLVLAAAGEHAAPAIDFTPAGGGLLGIRSLSELPDEARPLLRWGAAALALAALSIGLDYYELMSQRRVLADRAEQIYLTAMPSGSGGTGRKLKMEMRLKELAAKAEGGGTGASGSPLRAMSVLSQSVPKSLDVQLSQFELLPPNLKVVGRAESFEAVTKLQEALNKSGNFVRADVKDVHAAVSGGGVDFTLDLGIGEGGGTEARRTAGASETAADDAPEETVPDDTAAEAEAEADAEQETAPAADAQEPERDRTGKGDADKAAAKAEKAAARAAAKASEKAADKAARSAEREAQKKAKAEARAAKLAQRKAERGTNAARNRKPKSDKSDKAARADGSGKASSTRERNGGKSEGGA